MTGTDVTELGRILGMPVTLYALLTVISLCAAFLCMLILARRHGIATASVLKLAVLSIPMGLIASRIFFVIAKWDYYSAVGAEHALYLWEGGYLLTGALFGVFAAAWLISRKDKIPFARLLDLLSAPAALAIFLGRLAEYYDRQGKGGVLAEDSPLRFFPFAFVTDEWGEWQEWSWCIFVLEALAALVIFIYLILKKRPEGKNACMFLILFASCQIFFEQLRCDDFPRWLFVRVSQITYAAYLFALLLYAFIKRMKMPEQKRGLPAGGLVGLLVGFLLAAGICVVSEFALDGKLTNITYEMAYAAMAAACAAFALTVYRMCFKHEAVDMKKDDEGQGTARNRIPE